MKKTLDLAEMDAQTVTALPAREMPQILSGINVVLLNGFTIFVPINAAANICGIDVNVLAQEIEDGRTECDAQARQGGGGGN
jgi:hypothetical protein